MVHLGLLPRSVALLLVAALAACVAGPPPGGGTSEPPGSPDPTPSAGPLPLSELADYDADAPLELRELGSETLADGVTVHDVRYASPRGGEVSGWLVMPAGEGPFAGLVYQHGSETDRDDFLDEAVAMAHAGAASMVVDAPFARTAPDYRGALLSFTKPERERDMTAQALVDLRRAFDVLAADQRVDAGRLGFVGHSWGASLGAVLAAVDERPRALALLAGRPAWTRFLATSDVSWVAGVRERADPARWLRYLDLMAPFDATSALAQVAGERLFLQFGSTDTVISSEDVEEWRDAAPHGTTIDMYQAGHALNAAATAERVAWLIERLALSPMSDEILADVGLPDR